MRLNTAPAPARTHEGAPAIRLTPIQALKRTIMACMLWEGSFYENGESIAYRIKLLASQCDMTEMAQIAIEAREEMKLRHAPLLLVREMARFASRGPDGLVAATLARVIRRPDELAEFVAIYWADGKCPLSNQVKIGLSRAFMKFDEYQLAKWNRDTGIKLRDVLFLCHAKPKDAEQEALWKRLIDGTLETPDTWETRLSAGEDKKQAFETMLHDGTLGYMALLRNLRNMHDAGVAPDLVASILFNGAKKNMALPFRYIAAARAVPQWEPMIDAAMVEAMSSMDRLPGKTVLLIDVSGSMEAPLSSKSDLTRLDAACALAILARGVCDDVEVLTFSNHVVRVPPRNGMALADAIIQSQPHICTYLGDAVNQANKIPADRLIVITDEQSHDSVQPPAAQHAYMINVATHEHAVGYGQWMRISGMSEAVVSYIIESEKQAAQ